MPTYTQDGRPLSITTPLGKDVLLLVGINGAEAVSQLFHFRLDVLAENKTDVPFDKLLGPEGLGRADAARRQDAALLHRPVSAASPRASATRSSPPTSWRSRRPRGCSRGGRRAAFSSI